MSIDLWMAAITYAIVFNVASAFTTSEMSRSMGNETNEILKHDMQSDILVLLNRKNLLADMLNFT
jgi:hypothetical protein